MLHRQHGEAPRLARALADAVRSGKWPNIGPYRRASKGKKKKTHLLAGIAVGSCRAYERDCEGLQLIEAVLNEREAYRLAAA